MMNLTPERASFLDEADSETCSWIRLLRARLTDANRVTCMVAHIMQNVIGNPSIGHLFIYVLQTSCT